MRDVLIDVAEEFFSGPLVKWYCMDCVSDYLGEDEAWGVGDTIHVVVEAECKRPGHVETT